MKLTHILFFASLALPTAMGRVGAESTKKQRRDEKEVSKQAKGSYTEAIDVFVSIDFDDFPYETGIKIKQGHNVLLSRAEETFSDSSSYEELIQLMPGDYTFEITDSAGDGICCSYGHGSYEVYAQYCFSSSEECRLQLVEGNGVFGNKKTHSFTLPASIEEQEHIDLPNAMSIEWLDAHNTRRRQLHEDYNKEYVALAWSESLASGAQAYANELIAQNGCESEETPEHGSHGENIARTIGTTFTPDQVLSTWYENEYTSPHESLSDKNLHFTQVGWRASKYLGCGQASKSGCTIYVCRYIVWGNCGYPSSNWHQLMLAESSYCGPQCPSDGC